MCSEIIGTLSFDAKQILLMNGHVLIVNCPLVYFMPKVNLFRPL